MSRSQQRAAELVFNDGQIPDESNVKINKHRDQVEYTKSMPNFLEKMKQQALARRGLTAEQDLANAKEIQKFNAVHTVDDKRKHLESYEEPATAANSKAAAEQAQTDAEFEDEAFQSALRDMQQSSKPIKLTKANAAAAAGAPHQQRPIKRARTDQDKPKDDEKPKAKSEQPSKRNTMALSFAVDDGDD